MEKIEIPFGSQDSELKGWEYTIPDGMEAEIKDGKIIVKEKESEDERMIKAITYILYENYTDAAVIEGVEIAEIITWLEKQKESPMPNSTELIEMWDAEREMLEEKDLRGDTWRIAQNAFMDGFVRGTCVKLEKQIKQLNK